MAILTMPSYTQFAQGCVFGKDSNSRSYASPFNGRVQTLAQAGARWAAEYTLVPMTAADAAEWESFLDSLRGMAGRFYGVHPLRRSPRGSAGGTPLVQGGSQTGTSLVTDGWPTGQTGVLLKGDMIAFDVDGGDGRTLRRVTADVNSDGSGNATITLDEPIRTSPANNEPIIVTNPSCVMMLAEDGVRYPMSAGDVFTISFKAVEAYGA